MVNKFKNLIKEFYVIRTIKRGGLFDKKYYLKNNLDVARNCMNPIKHYVRHGWKEGRNPTQYFDTKWYLESYTDVANSSMNPFYHFVKYGIKENRKPSLDYSNYDHLNYEKKVLILLKRLLKSTSI